jgi:hypothetical protein
LDKCSIRNVASAVSHHLGWSEALTQSFATLGLTGSRINDLELDDIKQIIVHKQTDATVDTVETVTQEDRSDAFTCVRLFKAAGKLTAPINMLSQLLQLENTTAACIIAKTDIGSCIRELSLPIEKLLVDSRTHVKLLMKDVDKVAQENESVMISATAYVRNAEKNLMTANASVKNDDKGGTPEETKKKPKGDGDEVYSGSGSDDMFPAQEEEAVQALEEASEAAVKPAAAEAVQAAEAVLALKEAEEASKAAESAVSAVSAAATAVTSTTAGAAKLLLEKIHPDIVHAAELRYLSTLREMLFSFNEEAEIFLRLTIDRNIRYRYIGWEIEESTNSGDPHLTPVSVARAKAPQFSKHLLQNPVNLLDTINENEGTMRGYVYNELGDSFPMIKGDGAAAKEQQHFSLLSESSGDSDDEPLGGGTKMEQGGGRRRPVKKSTHRKPHRHTRNYQSRNKRKNHSIKKTTIKHRKSYRKHNRTIKRRKSRRHR